MVWAEIQVLKKKCFSSRSVWAVRASVAASSEWRTERREVTSPATSWTSSEMKSQSDEDRTKGGGGISPRDVRGGGTERSSPHQKHKLLRAAMVLTPKTRLCCRSECPSWTHETKTASRLPGDRRSLCLWFLFYIWRASRWWIHSFKTISP